MNKSGVLYLKGTSLPSKSVITLKSDRLFFISSIATLRLNSKYSVSVIHPTASVA